jgi:(p)ppGpp synthase/HD superfamily hydrolase
MEVSQEVSTELDVYQTLDQNLEDIRQVVLDHYERGRQDLMIMDLDNIYAEYNEALNLEQVSRAVRTCIRLHRNEYRDNDDPYIVHCFQAGLIPVILGAGVDTVKAALLHDGIEQRFDYNKKKGLWLMSGIDTVMSDIDTECGRDTLGLVVVVTSVPIDDDSLKRKYELNEQIKKYSKNDPWKRASLIRVGDRIVNLRTLAELRSKQGIASRQRAQNTIVDTINNVRQMAQEVDAVYADCSNVPELSIDDYLMRLVDEAKKKICYS